MYVCKYIHIYECKEVNKHECICVRKYEVWKYVFSYVCTNASICVLTNVCKYVCMFVYMYDL